MNNRLTSACLVCLGLSGCARHNSSASAVVTPTPLSAMQRQVKNAVDAGEGDYELRGLRDRVIAEPNSISARLNLARAYAKRGIPELALDHYRLAADRFPASAEAALFVARTLKQLNRGPEGAQSLQNFLTANPQPGPELYSWLGIIRDDSGDWKDGEAAHREALAKSDGDYLRNNLGYALLMQGKKAEAAVEFRAALKLNPHSDVARDNLGVALAGDPTEAILNWQSLNEPATAHSNLAALLMEQGKYPEARKELAVALQYNRANPAALANIKILSDMDGKSATIPEPTLSRSRWARAKAALLDFWNGSPAASPQPVQTVAKSPESKL